MTKVYVGAAVSGGAVITSPYATRAELVAFLPTVPQFTSATRPDPSAWIGKNIRVEVSVENSREYGDQNRIKKYMANDGGQPVDDLPI